MPLTNAAAAEPATITTTAMDDTKIYLKKLSDFSRILRENELPVSPRETEDAAALLTVLGMEDRARVKTALRTVFAKSRQEQLRFDEVFDNFFIPEEEMVRRAQEQARQEAEAQKARQEAQKDLDAMGDRVKLSQREQETYAAMSEEARQKLRRFMERYKGNLDRNPELYTEFIHSVFAKTIMEQQLLMENAGVGCEEADPEIGIYYRDIGDFKDTEIPKAISLIQTIARQINGELSAKRRGQAHSGKLDFRKTIRKGLETGGSFYRLKYRRRHARRKKLVMLCDVSGSMVQFSEFALRFIQSLNQVSESSETYLFSEEMVKIDAFQLANMDTFRDYVRASGLYGRGTDLGSALEKLCCAAPPVLGSAVTLLILSDTKTIDQNRAAAALLEAKRLSGRVLWLNPIPENKWQYLNSVRLMEGLVPMVSCSTLRELAAACKKLSIQKH